MFVLYAAGSLLAAAVMPLGAPIGTGLGVANTYTLRMMRELITEVPLVAPLARPANAAATCAAVMSTVPVTLMDRPPMEADSPTFKPSAKTTSDFSVAEGITGVTKLLPDVPS